MASTARRLWAARWGQDGCCWTLVSRKHCSLYCPSADNLLNLQYYAPLMHSLSVIAELLVIFCISVLWFFYVCFFTHVHMTCANNPVLKYVNFLYYFVPVCSFYLMLSTSLYRVMYIQSLSWNMTILSTYCIEMQLLLVFAALAFSLERLLRLQCY